MTNTYQKKIKTIVQLILKNQRTTREQLAEELDIKKSTLVEYIGYLLEISLIHETKIKLSSGGGRKPIYLELNPGFGSVLSIIIEKRRLISSLVDLNGTMLDLEIQERNGTLEKSSLINTLQEMVSRYTSQNKKINILGVAIAIGGSVDSANGISKDNLYIKNWKDVQLAKIIRDTTKLKTIIIKDIEALALGELYFGNGIGHQNLLSITLGDDIGMGIIARGELYTGASSCAGELGHVIVDKTGPLCYCGQNGCLEKMVSVETLLHECRKGLQQGVQSQVLNYINDDFKSLSIDKIIEASNKNDIFSMKLFRNIGGYIGEKISEIVNLFNPEIICLHGSLIKNNIFLFALIKDIVFSQSRSYNIQNLVLTYPEEQEYLPLKGAASIIFSSLPIFEDE